MFSLDFLVDHFQVYLLLLLRLSGFIFTAPIFGERYIPPQVKVVLSLLLALFFYVFAVPQGAQLIHQPLPYWVLLIKEVVWGFLIGFACQLVFIGVQFSGQITGFQMGFGVVNVIDPQSGGQVSIISRLQYLLAVLIFLAMDGHHFLLQALASSFDLLPLGQIEFASAAGERLLRLTGGVFLIAVKIAAPVMVSLLLTSVALGILARTVPQMNVFIVGFPLKIGIGMIALACSLPVFYYLLSKIIAVMEHDVTGLITLFAG